MTREPGDLPGRRHLPACGARARGGLPLWWQRELSSGPERPPCLCFCRFLRTRNRLSGRGQRAPPGGFARFI